MAKHTKKTGGPLSVAASKQRQTRLMEIAEANFGQILLEALDRNVEQKEVAPALFALAEVHRLFDPLLCRAAINLNSPMKDQVVQFLNCDQRYIALTRDGKFEALMDRDDGDCLLLKHLVEQAVGNARAS